MKLRSWGLLAGIVAGAMLLRVGLLDVPLERDEGEYAYTAQLLLDGIPPYAEAYNMKLPGIYVAYATILALLGEAPRDIHLGLALLNASTIVLLFLLGRRVQSESLALAAAAAFAVLSISGTVQGPWANAEAFVLPFALGGLLLTLRAIEHRRRREFAAAGLLLGLGFLMKQHGVFFVGVGGALVLAEMIRATPRERPPWAERLVILAVGALLPYVATCLTLWAVGVFDTFWLWSFEYARAYSGIIPIAEGPARFWRAILEVSAGGGGLWLLGLFGLAALGWAPGARGRRPFFVLFAAGSIAAVCPGLYFRPHYFTLLLPVLALLVGLGAQAAGDLLDGLGLPKAKRWAPTLLVVLALMQALFAQRTFLFVLEPTQVTRAVYGLSPFPESIPVADFLREVSEPEDRIAILGSEPQIPFYAGRRKASGYLYVYPLMEDHALALSMQRGMIREIEASRPRFLIFVNVASSWQRRPESRTELLEWLDGYIRRFRLVGRVAMSREGTRFFTADELSQTSSCAANCIEIFERLPD